MKKYAFVGIAACFGAIIRYLLESGRMNESFFGFPVDTLLINVTGSFVLCLVLTIGFDVWKMNVDVKQGITTGFIGAFTTFSTFCKETVVLLQQNNLVSAGTYILVSLVFGIMAAFAGCSLGNKINHTFREKNRILNERKGDA